MRLHLRWFCFTLLGAQIWACSAFAIEPGSHFNIQIQWPLFIEKIQELEPVEVLFHVDGCDNFKLLGVMGDNVDSPSALPYINRGHGDFATVFRLGTLLQQRYSRSCSGNRDTPYETDFHLAITCEADGRTKQSNVVPVRFAVAAAAYVSPSVHSIWPMQDPNHLFVASAAGIGMVHFERNSENILGRNDLGVGQIQNFALQPTWHSFVQQGDRGYLSDGCMLPICGDIAVRDAVTGATATVHRTSVYVLDVRERAFDPNASAKFITDVIAAPGDVFKLIGEDDGSIRMLSGDDQTLIVSHLVGKTLHIEHVWVGEKIEPTSRWYGDSHQPTFLSVNVKDGSVALRNVHASSRLPLKVPGHGDIVQMTLADDGRRWHVQRGDEAWFGDSSGTWQQLPIPKGLTAVLWTRRGVAVQAQTAETAPVMVFESVKGVWAQVGQYDAEDYAGTAKFVGDKIVLWGFSTLTVLDERGHYLGGADLAHCRGSNYYPPIAMGDDRLGIITQEDWTRIYLFDLAQYTP